MAEYRIVAKVDPQTAAGSNKVKQDLRGIQNEARQTEDALNRSFDQARFEKTIGGLVAKLTSLEKSMDNLSGAAFSAAKANETTGDALDRVAAAAAKAKAQTDGHKTATDQNRNSQQGLETTLRRVLTAIDAEAAEQLRLNDLLRDAKRLLDAGKISQEQYGRAVAMATEQVKEGTRVTGQQRAGYQQLGYQLGDVATMYSLGARPAQIFGSQIGQITQAVQLLGGDNNSMLSKVARFMGGPWGIALSTATILLAPFIGKLLEGNDALADSIDKLKKDARETETAARAKEAFARTIEGVTAAIREQNEELQKGLETQRDTIVAEATAARQRLETVKARQAEAKQALEYAEDLYEAQKRRASSAGAGSEAAALGLSDALERVEKARAAYNGFATTIGEAEEAIRRADAAIAQNAAERAVDPIKKLNDQYDRQRRSIIEAAVASENFSAPALARELTQLEMRREAALKAAQAQDRLNESNAKGVAIFRSREQAIGIAGREFQKEGFRVGENDQFGGVSGNHPGMGNKAHGKYAVDINSGVGVVEADVPDLKAKFDAAARRYQARGYRVLWNGWVYEANGDGPTKRIPAGQGQHRDHMHLEAPQTIVGKPTQSSTESQYSREESQAEREAAQAARLEERASDFVGAVVTRAASRGLPNNRSAALQAEIDEAFADFERRFNRAASFAEKWEIATALTEADAREIEQAFQQAYVAPLERLEALQGKTGVERAILNAKLEETTRLGRELTPVEEQIIENGIRQIDNLERQSSLLQQIKGPMDEYRATIAALNALLAEGAINHESYNARMAEMTATAAGGLAGLPGIDPNTGMNYDDISAVADENARYAKQLEEYANYREQLQQMGVDYDALREAAYQEHMNRLADIDRARREIGVNAIADMAGSVTSIMKDMFGEQSAMYKAAFAAEKAVAIARSIIAIQTGIAQAAALPFPANLPAIASVIAATASIISNIQAVSLNLKDGGMVRGPGGPRSDSVPANLSNGEFVVNAAATSRNRALLEAINSGREVRQANVAQAAAEGRASAPAAPVSVQVAPAAVRVVNVTDPREALVALDTAEGEQVQMNFIERNAGQIARLLGAAG